MTWMVVVAGLAVGTLVLRFAGVFLGSRLGLSPQAERGLALAATVMLCALVVSTTLSSAESGPSASHVHLARLGGVGCAGLLAWRNAPLWLVVVAAAVVTAGLRWAGL